MALPLSFQSFQKKVTKETVFYIEKPVKYDLELLDLTSNKIYT